MGCNLPTGLEDEVQWKLLKTCALYIAKGTFFVNLAFSAVHSDSDSLLHAELVEYAFLTLK